MDRHKFTRIIATAALCIGLLIPLAQCKKRSDPARLIINVDGSLLSNAMITIDGKQAGKLIQTFIQPDGQLFIDGKYTVTLPAGHHDIPDADKYTGALDSLRLKAGQHTIILQGEEGTSLQVTVNLQSGLNMITYNSDDKILNWNDVKITAHPGEPVNLQ